MTALDVARTIRSGEQTASALARAALDQAASAAHVFTALTEERAVTEARAADERARRGAPLGSLDGTPIAWKDVFDVQGTITTGGSRTRRSAPVASADAPVVARLAARGLVCIGKTNLSELAFSALGLNPHFGTPANPVATDVPRAPGGSSSGSAVAVASGIVPCAIGTDTSGSVRIPAAFCGLVGFRPSIGGIPMDGVLALSPSLDAVGPITRTVGDAIVLDAALRDAAEPAAAATPAGRLTVLVPEGELVDDVEPAISRRFELALAALSAAGVTVVRRPVRAFEDAQAAMDEHGTIVGAEAARVHASLLEGPGAAELDPRVLRRLEQGRSVTPRAYAALLHARAELRAAAAAEVGDAVTAFPTVRMVAPPLVELESDVDRFLVVNARALRSTMIGAFLDMPGVSVPIPGAPAAGFLLSARAGADDALLSAALTIEATLQPAAAS
jgi:aspartyl-tRNA(Asn)/glutamyl-tRNA(Gln) amidotransferase subunit A